MSSKKNIAELPDFDTAGFLQSEQDIATYLTAILDDDDPSRLAAALGDMARARGMSRIASQAGVAREALYKALRPGSQPRFETIRRVCAALGVRLVAQPLHPGGENRPTTTNTSA
jgi:probable addiction module antidote protein